MFISFASSHFAAFPNLTKHDVNALYGYCSQKNEQRLIAELRIIRMNRSEKKQGHIEVTSQDPAKFPYYRRLCEILLKKDWSAGNIIDELLDSELDNYLKVELYINYLNQILTKEINPLPLFQQFFILLDTAPKFAASCIFLLRKGVSYQDLLNSGLFYQFFGYYFLEHEGEDSPIKEAISLINNAIDNKAYLGLNLESLVQNFQSQGQHTYFSQKPRNEPLNLVITDNNFYNLFTLLNEGIIKYLLQEVEHNNRQKEEVSPILAGLSLNDCLNIYTYFFQEVAGKVLIESLVLLLPEDIIMPLFSLVLTKKELFIPALHFFGTRANLKHIRAQHVRNLSDKDIIDIFMSYLNDFHKDFIAAESKNIITVARFEALLTKPQLNDLYDRIFKEYDALIVAFHYFGTLVPNDQAMLRPLFQAKLISTPFDRILRLYEELLKTDCSALKYLDSLLIPSQLDALIAPIFSRLLEDDLLRPVLKFYYAIRTPENPREIIKKYLKASLDELAIDNLFNLFKTFLDDGNLLQTFTSLLNVAKQKQIIDFSINQNMSEWIFWLRAVGQREEQKGVKKALTNIINQYTPKFLEACFNELLTQPDGNRLIHLAYDMLNQAHRMYLLDTPFRWVFLAGEWIACKRSPGDIIHQLEESLQQSLSNLSPETPHLFEMGHYMLIACEEHLSHPIAVRHALQQLFDCIINHSSVITEEYFSVMYKERLRKFDSDFDLCQIFFFKCLGDLEDTILYFVSNPLDENYHILEDKYRANKRAISLLSNLFNKTSQYPEDINKLHALILLCWVQQKGISEIAYLLNILTANVQENAIQAVKRRILIECLLLNNANDMVYLIPSLTDLDVFWWKFKTRNKFLAKDVSLFYHLLIEGKQSLLGYYFSYIKNLDNAIEIYAEITAYMAQHAPRSLLEIIQYYPKAQQATLLRNIIERSCAQGEILDLENVSVKLLNAALNIKNNSGQTFFESFNLNKNDAYRCNPENAIPMRDRNEPAGAQYRFLAHQRPNLKRDILRSINYPPAMFEVFLDAIDSEKYNQALRRICSGSSVHALKLVKILLDPRYRLPININEQAGIERCTALHSAARAGNHSIYDFLLSLPEIDPEIEDSDGNTASVYISSSLMRHQ